MKQSNVQFVFEFKIFTKKTVAVTKVKARHLKSYLESIQPAPETLDASHWFPDGFLTQQVAAALGDDFVEKLKRLTLIMGAGDAVSSFGEFLERIIEFVESEQDIFTIEGCKKTIYGFVSI